MSLLVIAFSIKDASLLKNIYHTFNTVHGPTIKMPGNLNTVQVIKKLLFSMMTNKNKKLPFCTFCHSCWEVSVRPADRQL